MVLFVAVSFCPAAPIDYENNIGNALNETVYLASPGTAVQVKVTGLGNASRTVVAVNDDPDVVIFYGDSGVTFNNGQKIQPGEKVTFQGVNPGFNFWIVTQSGSAQLRVVEHQ